MAVVWLLRAPREIDEHDLRKRLSEALGERLAADAGAPNCFVATKPGLFLLRFRDAVLGVVNGNGQFFPDAPAKAREMKDVHLRQAVAEHRAFIAVEWPSTLAVKSRAIALRIMGKVMAELADEDCLAIYVPQANAMNWYQPGMVERLRGKDPLSALKVDGGLVEVMVGKPKLAEAVAEAQRRLPEFVAAFARSGGKAPFAVLAAFEDRARREFMWVDVTKIDREIVHGILRNKPNRVRGFRAGQKVGVKMIDVVDWIYGEGGTRHGAFTTALDQE